MALTWYKVRSGEPGCLGAHPTSASTLTVWPDPGKTERAAKLAAENALWRESEKHVKQAEQHLEKVRQRLGSRPRHPGRCTASNGVVGCSACGAGQAWNAVEPAELPLTKM